MGVSKREEQGEKAGVKESKEGKGGFLPSLTEEKEMEGSNPSLTDEKDK